MSDAISTLTTEQRAAVQELVELKRKHRALREDSANVCAKTQRGKFCDLKDQMDALRNQEAEIINRFPNEQPKDVNDSSLHQKLHTAANFLLDMTA